ncbi:hypothetical protein [Rhizobium halophytocola]|uniref:Polymerase n=1 Tax=Rhizobium halophytocola TaxID=735519 RepID=A0ABS4E258_9HYPH|nr:hypothetical protein [Rhizobium halophytocola]MBP1852030.1 putative polymerase [Rhizobium halophytocola]
MSVAGLHSASRYGTQLPAAPDASDAPLLVRWLAVFAVMGGLTVNLFLCFVNTRITGIHPSWVMAGEALMIAAAGLAALDRRLGLYLMVGVFVSYMIFLFAMRHAIDPKPVRDVLIPILFYFTGSRLRDPVLGDRMVVVSAVIVTFFGLFEYLATDLYLQIFNILGYYIARGTVTLQDTYGATTGLFASGLRPEPRTLLPFLGQHRVSSVFLEPVSAGNFGVIIFCWAYFRKEMGGRWLVIAAAMTSIVLADARFGFLTCVAIVVLAPFFRFIPRVMWLAAPLLLLAVISAYGLHSGTEGGPNDIAGRFKVTASLLARLTPEIVFGMQTTDSFTADSGLAYTLTQFGLFGFIFIWWAAVYAPARTTRAWQFHAGILVYMILLLLISNSLYSIKTAGLMWCLLGIADHASVFSAPTASRRKSSA